MGQVGVVGQLVGVAVVVVGLLAFALKESYEKQQLLSLLKTGRKESGRKQQAESNDVYLKKGEENQNQLAASDFPIYKIAITGGPCAGKSTSLGSIRSELEKNGFRVLGVPQIPTLVVKAGGMILMSRFNLQERIKFQTYLIHLQMYIEDYFIKLAAMSKMPAIVLCDRGTVDPAAYVSTEEFQAILDEEGWNLVSLRDRRYDRVIFLQSAAAGAERFYSLENNVARSEGIELARSLDKKTLQVWTGHPHLTIVPNVEGESFQTKIERAVEAVRTTVGLEKSQTSLEKFLIRKPDFPQGLKFEVSQIQEIFLKIEDERYIEDKLKRQGQNKSYTYQRKLRGSRDEKGNFKLEIRKPLTSVQYAMLKEQRIDPRFRPILRKRISFTYNVLSYSIDVYSPGQINVSALGDLNIEEGIHILRFESEKNKNPRELIPPFMQALKDVRQESAFSLHQIAKVE